MTELRGQDTSNLGNHIAARNTPPEERGGSGDHFAAARGRLRLEAESHVRGEGVRSATLADVAFEADEVLPR